MAPVTTNELKEHLQLICNENKEIRDVFYYESTGTNEVTVSAIVVVYITHYAALTNSIRIASFTTVEKAVVFFKDTSDYTIVDSKLTANITAVLIPSKD
jgi:hypothetical protein